MTPKLISARWAGGIPSGYVQERLEFWIELA
ncbi:hypothetical protein SAMN06265221_13317 [Paracoccus laeviglucosivorans]|uniref:Uncharacterized protein n=1 Tax=Paracoccus laeviglucosivorans TaxID=1197861 RepID=A0A521FS74_9RHOB|nr:hypothetical protein SAMN06265221_13317 [Paracoccus laeviglucosivorans]